MFLSKVWLAAPVFVSETCLHKYRQHPASWCARARQSGEYYSARAHFTEWLTSYLRSLDTVDPRVWEALEQDRRSPPQRSWLARVRGRLAAIFRGWRSDRRQPAVGRVGFGDLRRLHPISRRWGYDRGNPIDRYYIERFLDRHRRLIAGRVLEVGDDRYTRQFGGTSVQHSDVLHVSDGSPSATIVADLTCADHIPSNTFDCVILCQTLQLIYEPAAALRTIARILKPGGVTLATFPGISQTSDATWRECWYWSFTSAAARRLFGAVFGAANIEVQAHGNVLAAIGFLHGLAAQELSPNELSHHDPDYETLITVMAVKRDGAGA